MGVGWNRKARRKSQAGGPMKNRRRFSDKEKGGSKVKEGNLLRSRM